MDLNIPIGANSGDVYDIYGSDKKYIYALNANLQNEEGNSLVLQNEHSNFLCSMFKPGYRYLHHQSDRVNNRTYFFLKNEGTGCSEIGVIKHHSEYSIEDIEKECKCSYVKVLSDPLEDTEQLPLCTYETLLTDCCGDVDSKCLDFDVKNRISSEIKIEENRIFLYWGQRGRPRRKTDLNNLDYYRYKTDPCNPSEPVDDCLDCDKLRIDVQYLPPCLAPEAFVEGNLEEGAILARLAYCDESGNELSSYVSETNWIMVKNLSNKIYQPHELDRNSGLGIKFKVSNLDSRFYHYTIGFVQVVNTPNAGKSYFKTGVFPVSQDTVVISSTLELSRDNMTPELLAREKVSYTGGRFPSIVNNQLFWGDLTAQGDPNLQKVFNLLGEFAKCRVAIAGEDLYKDGVNCSLYEQPMGDESYPYSITLTSNTGYKTPRYHLISRRASTFMLDGIETDEKGDITIANNLHYKYISDNSNRATCSEYDRNKWFQYYNTAGDAEIVDLGCAIGIPSGTIDKTFKRTIVSDDEYLVPEILVELKSGVSKDKDYSFTTLTNYWYKHSAKILSGAYTDEFGLGCIVAPVSCIPDPLVVSLGKIESLFPNSCAANPISLVSGSEEVVITEDGDFERNPDGSIKIDKTFKAASAYDIPYYDGYCMNKKSSNGVGHKYETDIEASEALWVSESQLFPHTPCSNPDAIKTTGNIVFKRNNTMKLSCNLASPTAISNATIDLWNDFFVPYDIQSGATISTYQNIEFNSVPQSVTSGSVVGNFTDKLHTNAVWYKFDNIVDDSLTFIFNKSSKCDDTQDALDYSDYIRVSVYDDCAGGSTPLSPNLVYTKIVNIKNGAVFQLDYQTLTAPTPSPVVADTQYKILEKKKYLIAIDTPMITIAKSIIISANNDGIETNDCEMLVTLSGLVLSGTCGCGSFKVLSTETLTEKFKLIGAKAKLRASYSKECTLTLYGDLNCAPQPIEQYRFAYNESSVKYPCNNELYDSSDLTIPEQLVPASYRTQFESTFASGISGGNYVLDPAYTNFMDTPIRHFKYPEIPVQDGEFMPYGGRNKIYIKGFWVDNELVNAFLDIAVVNNLITQEFRDSIVGFEIYRGDRRIHKSVIAKGLTFDMLQYTSYGKTKQTQNYPFNDLNKDALHADVTHNIDSDGNSATFVSPNTFFQRPTLTSNTEVKLNYFLYGETNGQFVDVEDYPKMILLSPQAYSTAELLAITEVAMQGLIKISEVLSTDNEVFRFDAGFTVSANPGGIATRILNIVTTVVTLAVNAIFKIGQIKSQWIQIFQNNGTPENFASMYVGKCRYESYYAPPQISSMTLRPIAHVHYLLGESYEVNGMGFQDISINNNDRESCVYMNLGTIPGTSNPIAFNYGVYRILDTSRYVASTVGANEGSPSREVVGRTAMSPYVTLKNFVPDQYGSIDSIKWYRTPYCGDLTRIKNEEDELVIAAPNTCDIIYGGDTYVSRFSFKRKMRMFRNDIWNAPSDTAFNHSEYPYLTAPKYYIDYKNQRQDSTLFAPYTTIKSGMNLDSYKENGNYIHGDSKFYLYYYGIVSFLVESEYNCNFRYGQNEKELNYYENCGDVLRWCQQKNVRFELDNWSGGYNPVFSKDEQIHYSKGLPATYNKRDWDAFNDLQDRAIYSDQDTQTKGLNDPLVNYRLNNFVDFGKEYGRFFGIVPMDNMRALGRFENGFVVFNAYSTIEATADNYIVGTGGIFKNRPQIEYKSDLGSFGTQHSALCNTPYGSFWVDAKRGQAINLKPGKEGAKEISSSEYNWFKENLPFNILKDFPDIPLNYMDNPMIGLGISMGYDARFSRVFITKKDARIKSSKKASTVFDIERNGFFYTEGEVETEVFANDDTYFDDYSWTRAYFVKLDGSDYNPWSSFYSFKPDFYIAQQMHFQTGFAEGGLWSHLISNRSYQVYYGTRYPFKLITSIQEKFIQQSISNYEYWLDVRRYHNEKDFASLSDKNFDWACVYTKDSNSGKLVLVNRDKNKLSQNFTYPKFNADNIEILSSNLNDKFSFNSFYDIVSDKNNNVPIWISENSNDDRTLNINALDYRNNRKDRIKGDVINVLLVQEKESRLKYIVRFIIANNKPQK